METISTNNNDNEAFDEWINVKKALHIKNSTLHFSEGEVWWCGMGKNADFGRRLWRKFELLV